MALGQRLDLRRMLGRDIGAQLDDDAAVLGVEIERVRLGPGGAADGRNGGDERGGERKGAAVDEQWNLPFSLYCRRPESARRRASAA